MKESTAPVFPLEPTRETSSATCGKSGSAPASFEPVSETGIGLPLEFTCAFTYTGVPCVIAGRGPAHEVSVAGIGVVERHSVVVVGVNAPTAVGQLLTRLNALTEPRPVARSRPGAVFHADAAGQSASALKSTASSTP